MECPNCHLVNREEAVFCLECGAELGIKCPNCEKSLPPLAKFCDTCGQDLKQPKESVALTSEPVTAKDTPPPKPIESERKHVTALFSDLSGYTAYQSEGYFDFKEMGPAAVKGKTDPVRIYKVIAQKEQPINISGLEI